MTILRAAAASVIGKNQWAVAKPRDRWAAAVEGGFAQDRVVRATVEADGDLLLGHADLACGLDELAKQVLRFRLRETLEPTCQPAIAAVGDHRQRDIEIDVETDLAGQTVEMEKVDADAETVLDAVAPRVAYHQVARRDVGVVTQK